LSLRLRYLPTNARLQGSPMAHIKMRHGLNAFQCSTMRNWH